MKNNFLTVVLGFIFVSAFAQEGTPVYWDYLTDNEYLVHPSMAGAGKSGKLRFTAREQWFGVKDSPSLQTLSYNDRIGNTQNGIGFNMYSDKNGYHNQYGLKATYAYHLLFSRNELYINMLSFGLSAGFDQFSLDETDFNTSFLDEDIYGSVVSAFNFNTDFSLSYHYMDFHTSFTVKNLLDNRGVNTEEDKMSYNTRTSLLGAGWFLGTVGGKTFFEPSAMIIFKDKTDERAIDLNLKMYNEIGRQDNQFWMGASFRRNLDRSENDSNSSVTNMQFGNYATGMIGIDLKSFVMSYTYSHQMNEVVLAPGFHQLSLGFNFNKRRSYFIGIDKFNRRRR